MRVSLNWLKEFVPIELSPPELAHRLTMTGTEVDSIEYVKPEFEGVAVGQILKISRHPSADKLVLCEVDVGRASPLPIVCGAPNITEGDKVPVALVGAKLTGGVTVRKAKIRGQVSEGMLCSERELGLSEDHSGIKILPPDIPVGMSLDEALDLSEVLFELGITPNRPDCLSVLGIAREIAAITGAKIPLPQVDVGDDGPDIGSLSSVTIEDEIGCPRYAARIVTGVQIGPSPAWMQQRLTNAGLRPVNNVVDATNYVLMELGHPLHAFDYEKLDENRIVVRRGRSGESIVTLDGANRLLSEQMLVIADAEKPVAVAGVMGGANSEVSEQTRTVLIESAYFDPVSIRRTSKALGLSTEASYRFERGADPEMVMLAVDRTAELMARLAGGRIAKGRIDQYPHRFVPLEIRLRHARIEKILGIRVDSDAAASILESLGFEIISREKNILRVRVPSHRPDVTAEIDLIEEVARIYGYEKIPATYPQDRAIMRRGMAPRSPEDECRNVLKSCGFSEVITFSFGSPANMADFPDSRPEPLKLRNPLAEDESVLRTTLIPGILQTIRSNVNIGRKNLKIFEVGKVFWPPMPGELLPDERVFVCAGATGFSHPIDWKARPSEIDFFDLKGVAETLMESLGYPASAAAQASHRAFHPGICADILVDGKTVGKIGEIHPDLVEKYEIRQNVYVFEIDLSSLELKVTVEQAYEKPSRFPSSERDMAIVVDEGVEAAAVSSAIAETGGDILRNVVLFDIYRGAQVGEGKKSLAFSLRFQSGERTLTDEEITVVVERTVAELEKRFGATLRR